MVQHPIPNLWPDQREVPKLPKCMSVPCNCVSLPTNFIVAGKKKQRPSFAVPVIQQSSICIWLIWHNLSNFINRQQHDSTSITFEKPFSAWLSAHASLSQFNQSGAASAPVTCVTDCDHNKTAFACWCPFMVHLQTALKNMPRHVKSERKSGKMWRIWGSRIREVAYYIGAVHLLCARLCSTFAPKTNCRGKNFLEHINVLEAGVKLFESIFALYWMLLFTNSRMSLSISVLKDAFVWDMHTKAVLSSHQKHPAAMMLLLLV